MDLGAVAGVAGGFVGAVAAVLGFRLKRRLSSGTVETSTAHDLWMENSRLVDRLTKEIDQMRTDLHLLSAERNVLKDRVHELELEVVRLRFGHAAAAVMTVPHSPSPAGGAP